MGELETPIIRKLEKIPSARASSSFPLLVVAIIVLFVVLGLGTGYLLSQSSWGEATSTSSQEETGEIQKGKIFGSTEEKSYPDKAEGLLEKGGFEGEGSHKLIREGGESQTAYLSSLTLDLDTFVGRKVRVWGRTYQGQKAAWFMDVGRIEILE